jgi:hypothetical protein
MAIRRRNFWVDGKNEQNSLFSEEIFYLVFVFFSPLFVRFSQIFNFLLVMSSMVGKDKQKRVFVFSHPTFLCQLR